MNAVTQLAKFMEPRVEAEIHEDGEGRASSDKEGSMNVHCGGSCLSFQLWRQLVVFLPGKERDRGQFMISEFAEQTFVTVHPSSLLRAVDEESRQRDYHRFVAELCLVAQRLKNGA